MEKKAVVACFYKGMPKNSGNIMLVSISAEIRIGDVLLKRCCLFLSAFAKLRKATISFVMSNYILITNLMH